MQTLESGPSPCFAGASDVDPSLTFLGDPAALERHPDITAICDCHDITWWSDQPGVRAVLIQDCEDDALTFFIDLWLSHVAPPATRPDSRLPDRESDLQIYNAGRPHPAFWAGLTGLEHVEFCAGDHAWNVQLWFPAGTSPAIDVTDA
jgi:hypothetical protein